MKKLLAVLISLSVILTLSSNVFAESSYKDIENHWAKDVIESWSEYGIINGYDGYFSPDRSMTRGEFAVVLDRIMKYQDKAENVFADLDDNFYKDSILKLNKAGVIKGDGNNVMPKGLLTREEAAVMICRALDIFGDASAKQAFDDASDVSYWAMTYMNAMINNGFMNGYDNNKLLPKRQITRAEVIKILDNTLYPVIKAGEVKNLETKKTVIISSGDVTFTDCKILGEVKITKGVVSGDITIKNSLLNGKIWYKGDRKEFVKVSADSKISDGDFLDGGALVKEKAPSTGGNTGSGNTGGNTGSGNTGSGNTGGNTGSGNTGSGNTGGNTGSGNTGSGNTGSGNTGSDNTGGGNTGSGDNNQTDEPQQPDNPDEPQQPEEPEVIDNSEMLERLQIVQDDLWLYLNPEDGEHYSFFYAEEKALLKIIKTCIDSTIEIGNTKKITADFIKEEFDTEIATAKSMYADMEADGTAGPFGEKIANSEFDVETLFWLADAFGISY